MPKAKSKRSKHGETEKGSRRRHRTPSLVHWFRKGLRLHDNPSLREGLKGVKSMRCIYILDPWFAGSCDKGVNKWRFLLQCLEDLDSSLRKLNSRLYVIRGQPADVLPKLFREWRVTKLSFDEDSEPFARERDQAIQLLAKDAKVEVITMLSHTLYDPLEILHLNNDEPPLTYKRFQSIVRSMDLPPHPVESITSADLEGITMIFASDNVDRYGIPTLEELGFDTENIPPAVWIGGETEANHRLDRHLERKAWVANFERPRMSPASLMASSTGLGPYLRFGCLSPRVFYWRLSELYQKVKKTTNIPLSLHGQLLWREFFYTVACNNPNFDTMVDNPICVQIAWTKNQEALDRWTEGRTGYPWIDAIMTQLRLEGWIHPLARHAVACFLTRGDLWINWEEGMKVFDEYLLEADWSVNAGNWIWLSCSSFYQHFFHCYCPIKFGKRTDPSGDYIRKYLPILKNYPKEYIFEPWNAPDEIQEQAKCIVGKDYPLPMVNHAEVSRINLEKMKKVYQEVSKYIGPGLLAAMPSSQEDSTPIRTNSKPAEANTHITNALATSTVNVPTYQCSTSSSQMNETRTTNLPSSQIMFYKEPSVPMLPNTSNVMIPPMPISSVMVPPMPTTSSMMVSSMPSSRGMMPPPLGMMAPPMTRPGFREPPMPTSGMIVPQMPTPRVPTTNWLGPNVATSSLTYTTCTTIPGGGGYLPANHQQTYMPPPVITSELLQQPPPSTNNYMVAASGNIGIPNYTATSMIPPPERPISYTESLFAPPLPVTVSYPDTMLSFRPSSAVPSNTGDSMLPTTKCTVPDTSYTDTILTSSMDNYSPLRMENSNPLVGMALGLSPHIANEQYQPYQ